MAFGSKKRLAALFYSACGLNTHAKIDSVQFLTEKPAMNQLASPSQLRMSLLRWGLFVIPAIMMAGYISGAISGSGDANRWYAELLKPAMQPPGWIFGVIWPILYFLTGLAFCIILHARGARSRMLAIGLFLSQLLLNLLWSPLFFGRHEVSSAFYVMLLLIVLAVTTTWIFGGIRKTAAWLMVPYLAWLAFAAYLNFEIDRLNPNAESLYVPSASSHIG
jgi:translocator protein